MVGKKLTQWLGLKSNSQCFKDEVVHGYWWHSSGTNIEACALYYFHWQSEWWGGMHLHQDSGWHQAGGRCGIGVCQQRLGVGLPVRGTSTAWQKPQEVQKRQMQSLASGVQKLQQYRRGGWLARAVWKKHLGILVDKFIINQSSEDKLP